MRTARDQAPTAHPMIHDSTRRDTSRSHAPWLASRPAGRRLSPFARPGMRRSRAALVRRRSHARGAGSRTCWRSSRQRSSCRCCRPSARLGGATMRRALRGDRRNSRAVRATAPSCALEATVQDGLLAAHADRAAARTRRRPASRMLGGIGADGLSVASGRRAAGSWHPCRRCALIAYLVALGRESGARRVKAVPLGQTAGQRDLRARAAPIAARCRSARSPRSARQRDISRRCSRSLMHHETQYSRLFRSLT